MKWLIRYVVALLPLAIVMAVWLAADWAFDAFGCVSVGKGIEPCFAFGYNITPFLGIGLFWFKLFLLPVAWVVCLTWFVVVVINHIQSCIAVKKPNP